MNVSLCNLLRILARCFRTKSKLFEEKKCTYGVAGANIAVNEVIPRYFDSFIKTFLKNIKMFLPKYHDVFRRMYAQMQVTDNKLIMNLRNSCLLG